MLKTFFLLFLISLFLSTYIISFQYSLEIGISIYGFVMIIYFCSQILFSYLNNKFYFTLAKQNWLQENNFRTFRVTMEKQGDEKKQEETTVTEFPFKSVLLMIGHREREDYWEKALLSIKNIKPDGLLKTYLIIDGNQEEDAYMMDKTVEIFNNHPLSFEIETIQISQRGKRGAMFYGLQKIKTDFPQQEKNIDVVVSDSDTELDENSILRLQECLHSNSNNGCATGLLHIYNQQDGILPKIINARYSYAFMIERAAASYFGCMTCCSGPISIYRLEILDEMIIQKFITQKFLNVKCEPGDDRHLTNLVLAKGYYARQTNMSKAGTEAPETWFRFLNQQLRWSRSFYRELYWQLKAIEKQSYYLCVMSAYENLFPIFLTFWLFKILYGNKDFYYLLKGFIISIAILLVRTTILFIYLRNWSAWYNVVYYPTYLLFLLPTKIYAMFSVLNNNWVTKPRKEGLFSKISCSPYFVFIGFWNLAIIGGLIRHIILWI